MVPPNWQYPRKVDEPSLAWILTIRLPNEDFVQIGFSTGNEESGCVLVIRGHRDQVAIF